MFWFKHCPKCVGDLTSDRDEFGPFVRCMQCGYIKYPRVSPIQPVNVRVSDSGRFPGSKRPAGRRKVSNAEY